MKYDEILDDAMMVDDLSEGEIEMMLESMYYEMVEKGLQVA